MLVSKNPSKWAKFGVDDSSGKQLSLYNGGNEIVSVIFSNKGQDYSHNFYRTVGEVEVYRTSDNIFYMLNVPPKPKALMPILETHKALNLKLNLLKRQK